MKCCSCGVKHAIQYWKIDPDDNLFDILKNLKAARGYNRKYAYFCETCVNKAKLILAQKLTSDQNSFSLNVTDDSTSKVSNDTSNSASDEFDASRKFYTETGTPERSEKPLPRPKPCPKRFKELKSIPVGSDRQEPTMPNITTQTSLSNSGAMELGGLMMSSPSPQHLIDDAIVSGQEASVLGQEAYVSDQDANISNSSFDVDVRGADTPGGQNSLSGKSKRHLDSNASSNKPKRRGLVSPIKVSITLPRRTEEIRTQHHQSPTGKSDTESDQSMSKKTRTQPRRVSTGKDDTDTLSSHDDTGALAPAIKIPRIRAVSRNLQQMFANDSFLNVNFHPRTMAG